MVVPSAAAIVFATGLTVSVVGTGACLTRTKSAVVALALPLIVVTAMMMFPFGESAST